MAESLRQAPALEDVSHSPPMMTQPLTLRAWPIETANVNDNCAADIAPVDVDWNALCGPAAPPEIVAAFAPLQRRRFAWRDAGCGLGGAFAIVIAVLCLIAR